MSPRFKRLAPAEETPGCRQYRVLVDDVEVGSVSNRPGGLWSATGTNGSQSSRFCHTRAEAVRAILPSKES